MSDQQAKGVSGGAAQPPARTGYDEDAIAAALKPALAPFIHQNVLPGTDDAVASAVAAAAVEVLRFYCGSPSSVIPRGILSAPSGAGSTRLEPA